ncbi:MAG: iron-containing alcohol dehydrogenase [Sulfolobales archaeon]|nr:iron-containing alcohol dehydrogenase [Sulfolobales archaeon]
MLRWSLLILPIPEVSQIDTVFTVRLTQAKIGVGATKELGHDLIRKKISKALLICGKNTYEKTEIIKDVIKVVESEGIEVNVWNGVEPEPTLRSIEDGIEYASGFKFDAIIAVGGGSSIDTAKLINLYTTYPTSSILDYIPQPVGNGKQIPGALKPLIAVPTTSGSGSETTPTAVFTVSESGLKFGLSHESLLPSLAIVDPLNTLTMPQSTTASTGLDALMHAIEAYTSKPYNVRPRPSRGDLRPVYVGSNPVTDNLAEKSIELIGKYLKRAYHNGQDLEARSAMSLASYLAGVALGNAGTHISHAISLVLGGITDAPHGVCVAITAPALLEILAEVMPEKLAKIAELLGYDDEISIKRRANKSVEAVKDLLSALDFPNGLLELGIKESDIALIAEKTLLMKRLLNQSPVNVNKKLIERILQKSLRLW